MNFTGQLNTQYVSVKCIGFPGGQIGSLSPLSSPANHSLTTQLIDWSVFRKASPATPGDPTRIYSPEDFDFSLTDGTAAVDAGRVLAGVTEVQPMKR